MSGRRNRGAALITVLLILAVMVVIAANMASRLTLEVRRTANLQSYTQAYWYSLAAEEFAKRILLQSASDSDRVHLNQSWAQTGIVFPLQDGGRIAGTIRDLRSCFNLNALAVNNSETGEPPLVVYQFRALLEALDVDSYQAEVITDSVRNWVRQDPIPVSGVGATDSDYEGKSPAYLAARSPMVYASELRAVEGVDAPLYRRLRPLVCALPDAELKININTLSPEQPVLLQALFTPSLTLEQAQEILEQRPLNGYDSVEAFLAEGGLSQLEIKPALKEELTVTSRFFKLASITEAQGMLFRLEAVMERVNNEQMDTLVRQFGGEQ